SPLKPGECSAACANTDVPIRPALFGITSGNCTGKGEVASSSATAVPRSTCWKQPGMPSAPSSSDGLAAPPDSTMKPNCEPAGTPPAPIVKGRPTAGRLPAAAASDAGVPPLPVLNGSEVLRSTLPGSGAPLPSVKPTRHGCSELLTVP